jgi:hypothetical protein
LSGIDSRIWPAPACSIYFVDVTSAFIEEDASALAGTIREDDNVFATVGGRNDQMPLLSENGGATSIGDVLA